MKEELDKLRRAVDEATALVIAAEVDLETFRTLERDATATRAAAEATRDSELARLTEARSALDTRLGIRIVAAPLPAGRLAETLVPTRHPAPIVTAMFAIYAAWYFVTPVHQETPCPRP